MKKLILGLALSLLFAAQAVAQNISPTVWAVIGSTTFPLTASSAQAFKIRDNGVNYIRAVATTGAWLSFNVSGGTEPATAATGVYIPPNTPQTFRVPNGSVIYILGSAGHSIVISTLTP